MTLLDKVTFHSQATKSLATGETHEGVRLNLAAATILYRKTRPEFPN